MRITVPIIVLALGASVASSASAGRALEGALEVRELHVHPGPAGRVRALGCGPCPKTFRLAEDVRAFIDGQEVPRKRMLERQGEPGTVIYNLESGQAVRLRW